MMYDPEKVFLHKADSISALLSAKYNNLLDYTRYGDKFSDLECTGKSGNI